MGLLEIVFVVLLVLKLVGAAQLSWLAVFAPLLLSFVLYVIIGVLFIAGFLTARRKF